MIGRRNPLLIVLAVAVASLVIALLVTALASSGTP